MSTVDDVAVAIDGLRLDWVLGLAPVNQELAVRVRIALEDLLARSKPARSAPKAKVPAAKRVRAHRS